MVGATRTNRLAEILGRLSAVTDLADGFPIEKALRTCVLAVRLGERRGLNQCELSDVYYAALLRYLGCTGFAHEEATYYGAGDDVAIRHEMALADASEPLDFARRAFAGVGRGAGASRRVVALAALVGDRQVPARHVAAQCDAARTLGGVLGMAPTVVEILGQVYERADGHGLPEGLPGEALHEATRIVQVADIAELFHHRYGRDQAVAVLSRRAGRQLDAGVTAVFTADADALLGELEAPSIWDVFLDAEPEPVVQVPESRVDALAEGFARYVDLKSVWTLGHSTGVAALVERASVVWGMDPAAGRQLRRAGMLHDLGRVAIPNGVWDKPGPLNAAERERARLHSYHTERVLAAAPVLATESAIAAASHERLDGHGYHRAVPASMLDDACRLLAAADVLHALGEDRPHRAALTPAAAADALSAEAASGHLDRRAVDAVLEAAGHRRDRHRAAWPAGLSDREVEVLRLVARGERNKDVARLLGISARTVQHHVAHVYTKVGCASRAGMALFAIDHDLLRQ